MQYRSLGDSDITVSALAFGAWQLGDPDYWGGDAEADAEAAVRTALDGGINLFDTAEMYGAGRSEEVLGRALRGARDRVVIASKVLPENCAPARLRAACEASLRRLGTDHIDLYQVHWPNRDVPFADTHAELDRLRAEGKIRAIGVSNFGAHDLRAWMDTGRAIANQLGYSLLFRAIEHEIVPACAREGVGILVYMPLLQGILTGRWRTIAEIPVKRRRTRHFSSAREGTRHGEPGCETLLEQTLEKLLDIAAEAGRPLAELALAWAMAQPGVTSVIAGARKPQQLARNLAAAHDPPEPALLECLTRATESLKDALGANPDMWLGGDDRRIW